MELEDSLERLSQEELTFVKGGDWYYNVETGEWIFIEPYNLPY